VIIRRRQIDAFSEYQMKDFRKRMAVYLRTTFPEKCTNMAEKPLSDLIKSGIAKARSYQLKTERELTMYLTLSVGLGPDLYESDDLLWARKLLYDQSMDGVVRLGFIFKLLAQQNAMAVGARD